MVRGKVEMGRKVESQRDIVETMGRHGVLGVENGVEIMRVPVIANEAVDGQPQVCLERVSLEQGATLVRRTGSPRRRIEQWLEQIGEREADTDFHVAPLVKVFVQTKGHDARKGGNPDWCVGQGIDFVRSLRWFGLGIRQESRGASFGFCLDCHQSTYSCEHRAQDDHHGDSHIVLGVHDNSSMLSTLAFHDKLKNNVIVQAGVVALAFMSSLLGECQVQSCPERRMNLRKN